MYPLTDISIVAVLLSIVANIAGGCLWYSPALFGKKWMQYVHLTEADASKGMGRAFALGVLATALSCFIIACILATLGPATMQEAVVIGLVLWAGFLFANELSGTAWEQRPIGLLAINAGWSLVGTLLTVVIVTALS